MEQERENYIPPIVVAKRSMVGKYLWLPGGIFYRVFKALE